MARREVDDHARLWDIVRWGERLMGIVRGVSWDEYQANLEKQIAVERCIEVIGEAARQFRVSSSSSTPTFLGVRSFSSAT